MNKRIIDILDNVRYWETCPEDYKKDIEDFLLSLLSTKEPEEGKYYFNGGELNIGIKEELDLWPKIMQFDCGDKRVTFKVEKSGKTSSKLEPILTPSKD